MKIVFNQQEVCFLSVSCSIPLGRNNRIYATDSNKDPWVPSLFTRLDRWNATALYHDHTLNRNKSSGDSGAVHV